MGEAIGSGGVFGKLREEQLLSLPAHLCLGRATPDTKVPGLAQDSHDPPNRHKHPVPSSLMRTSCLGTPGI